MSRKVTFRIPGKGQPKQRVPGGRTGFAYTPKKTVVAEAFVRDLAFEQMNNEGLKPFEGAVSLTVIIYRPIPKSFSKAKRDDAKADLIRPVTRPDLDNQIKLVKDALNGICFKDDSQVVTIRASKFYHEDEFTEVEVWEL